MRPEALKDIVGQEKLKTTLNMMIKSAKKRKTAIGHVLLCGASGRGKTTIARIIAKEMSDGQENRQMLYAHGSSLKDPSDLIPFLSSSIKEGDILFIDEIHGINKDLAEWLYIIMEDFWFAKPDGTRQQLPRFTIVGATTHVGLLPKPFKDRFKYIAELEDYTEEDLAKIAQKTANSLEIKLGEKATKLLVKTARFTPRLIINRVEFIRDYMIANDVDKVKEKDILEVLRMQGVDGEGLTDTDHKYLNVLRSGKTVSLKQLAAKIEVDVSTVQNEIEPFLLKKNFIEITNKGRQIVVQSAGSNIDDYM